MISASHDEEKWLVLRDESAEVDKDTLTTIQAALKAGLEEFTVPGEGEKRTHWKTRKWAYLKNGKLTCFLVAYQEGNAHFEIVGPEVDPPVITIAPAPAAHNAKAANPAQVK